MGPAHRLLVSHIINLSSCPDFADQGRNQGGKVMATVSRGLPEQPHLDVPKREARELLTLWHAGQSAALERVRHRLPKFKASNDAVLIAAAKLSEAQRVVAREYGFPTWAELKQRIAVRGAANELLEAISANDRERSVTLLRANPELLHLPLWGANWGPPMSHAANLGRLDLVQAISELGARDHQHAFDRAVLQGRIECARWLHAHGAKTVPGIIMGACETLNAEGFRFLLELGAPLTDAAGDRLASLALVLGTYARRPGPKHEILGLLEQRGYTLPDTPVMALHRGDVARLREHLRRDPGLLTRRFSLAEIYPAECGCGDGGGSGMYWTPIDGGTLLHLAVDFWEREVFAWLLAEGADVNAGAAVDAEGFGGHTPLFNAVVCGPGKDGGFAAALLERGAVRDVRVNLRKFLDWCAEPRWHEARNVTAAEWSRGFPEQGWVNAAAVAVVENEQT
jgi:hypothetical protein